MDTGQRVMGVYHDRKSAARAIRELINDHTPVEEIHVLVRDAHGVHDVPLQHRTWMVRDGFAGGIVGAVIGSVLATLFATGVWTPASTLMVMAGPIGAGLLGAFVGACAGGFVGALLGIDHWADEADLEGEDLERGAAMIFVDNSSLQQAARRTFERTGASQVDLASATG